MASCGKGKSGTKMAGVVGSKRKPSPTSTPATKTAGMVQSKRTKKA